MQEARRVYLDALIERQGAMQAPGKQRRAAAAADITLPDAPKLARVDEVSALVRDAVRESSIEFFLERRAIMAAGENKATQKGYNDAVGSVQASIEGASMVTRLLRDAAAVILAAGEDEEDPKALGEELAVIERDLRASTDATARADLIRKLHDHRARLDRAERAVEERAARPVTDLLLDARSLEILKNLSAVVSKGKRRRSDGSGSYDGESGDSGSGSDSGSDSDSDGEGGDHRFHDRPDPLRWYD